MHRHTLWCWLRRNVLLLSVFVSVPAVTLSFSTFLHSSLLSIAEHCGNDCLTRLFPCKCIINRRALTLNYWIVCVCLLATTSPHSCRFWFAVGAVRLCLTVTPFSNVLTVPNGPFYENENRPSLRNKKGPRWAHLCIRNGNSSQRGDKLAFDLFMYTLSIAHSAVVIQSFE